ncbi:unnamed protein product, partial [Pleuronectes platessa]
HRASAEKARWSHWEHMLMWQPCSERGTTVTLTCIFSSAGIVDPKSTSTGDETGLSTESRPGHLREVCVAFRKRQVEEEELLGCSSKAPLHAVHTSSPEHTLSRGVFHSF